MKAIKAPDAYHASKAQQNFCRGYGTCLAAAARNGVTDLKRLAEGYTIQQFADAGVCTYDLQLITMNWGN